MTAAAGAASVVAAVRWRHGSAAGSSESLSLSESAEKRCNTSTISHNSPPVSNPHHTESCHLGPNGLVGQTSKAGLLRITRQGPRLLYIPWPQKVYRQWGDLNWRM